MPVYEQRPPRRRGPRGGPLPWLVLYVLAIMGLVAWFDSLVAWESTILLIVAAIVGVSFLLGLRLGEWALLGPVAFCVVGFTLLLVVAPTTDAGTGLALAVGSWLIILGALLAFAGVAVGIFVALWRWTGRDD